MALEHLFNGNALSAVDAKGRLSVPAFIRSVIERRSSAKEIVIGIHEVSPCLNAYDQNWSAYLFNDNERLRLLEEAAEGDRAAHHDRARRTFGFTEVVPYDTSGRIILPPMMRRKGQIDDMALFLGVGGTFEIWNPRLALEVGKEELREIAAYRLEEKGVSL